MKVLHSYNPTSNWSYFGFLLILLWQLSACKNSPRIAEAMTAEDLHQANRQLIEITMEDVFNPPLASRIFCYPNLVAFEVYNHKTGRSIINQSIKNGVITIPDSSGVDFSIASLHAFALTARKLVFSEYMIDSLIQRMHRKALAQGQNEDTWKKSCAYGEQIASQAASWIKEDNYANVKADDQYTIRNADSTWVLTPPNYEQALEPNWKKMRFVFLSSFKDFTPKPRPVFSSDKQSDFYKHALEVMNIGKQKNTAYFDIAKHWDCNPNEFNDSGHNTHFNHKISPPGHWVNITTTLCKKQKASLAQASQLYAAVTAAMYDGLIVCWHTKYTEELIRPVTYINRYIDKTWLPFIQTPPFPEFTSGHSTVSGAASSILELAYPNTVFIDSTEVEFGLQPRTFHSVAQAGEEASYSRLYGGIHYRFGVEYGYENGQKIGQYIFQKLNKK